MLIITATFVCSVLSTQSTTTIERWGQWEDTWPGPTAGNPFVDVELSVEFSPPSGASYTVRGFYDGEGLFRARFMPPSLGAWTFRTQSNASVLDDICGGFVVVAPSAGNHGPVIARGTNFAHADGSPHHSVGTTVYGLFGAWVSDDTNLTAQTLKTLSTSPFNKVRVMAFPVGSGPAELLPYLPQGGVEGAPSDLSRFNVQFWRHIDDVVRSLLALGVQADIILFNLYMATYPAGLACMGGPNASTYELDADTRCLC